MFKGEKRVLEMDDKFFPGYRKTVLKSEEILLSIEIPYTRKVCIWKTFCDWYTKMSILS